MQNTIETEQGAKLPSECTYHAFYKGRKLELTAPTSYAAQVKAAGLFKAKRAYEVTVVIVGRADGSEVIHTPTF